MPENNNQQAWAKARAFFERARKVAESKNYDYAIDMYLEGLRCVPDALQQGHIPLRELALLRQGKGGKKPSMVEKIKRLKGKTPLDRMISAEYMLAKDPDHLPYAVAMLKAAATGGYKKSAKWIADLVFQANNGAGKPSLHTYLILKDAYRAIGEFDRAIAACQCAARMKPDDGELDDELKNLSAELTVAKGNYDKEGDFRKAIKNRQAQEKLHAQRGSVKTESYRRSALEEARDAYQQDPELPNNIFNLANVLVQSQEQSDEDEAIQILHSAYEKKKDFSFEQRAGEIRIKQLEQNIRQLNSALEARPDDQQITSELTEAAARLRRAELEHYRLCVKNYPTDLAARYEYANCLMQNKQYDDAIPLFQEAQKNPRRKISAMSKMGMCFFHKGWFADAVDIFTQAIDAHELKDDNIAKELRYNLALALEQQGETEKALEIYRKIAQLDFAYKDVRKRVDELRNK